MIEDAAHAPGASLKNQKAGTFGDLSCFSFFSTKNITTGEGGMITTDSSDLLNKCSSIRNRGLDIESKEESFIRMGGNYRMTEFSGAFGKAQLRKFPKILESSKKRYFTLFENICHEGVKFRNINHGKCSKNS